MLYCEVCVDEAHEAIRAAMGSHEGAVTSLDADGNKEEAKHKGNGASPSRKGAAAPRKKAGAGSGLTNADAGDSSQGGSPIPKVGQRLSVYWAVSRCA